MLQNAISHARLMRESADRVHAALGGDDAREQWIAQRVSENAATWQQWENEHSSLMRQIADYGVRRTQSAALKQATFRLVHGKALFQFLRESDTRGPARVKLLAHFRPGRRYENALVSEHNSYLRKACSFMCATHVGSAIIEDDDFIDPIARYDELYAEYFDLYCKTLVQSDDPGNDVNLALLPLLKHQLNEYRWAILDPRRAQPFIRRERDMRRPLGDTQRMPNLKPRK